ncbi:hypothetical protein N7490_003109 [Penicillium lividum]|nr:hypothetical protein N7490_003109 [Penicillium lividum]
MMKETSERKRFELMPTEILFCVVNCLQKRDIKQFSLVNKRARDVCLPFLFYKIRIDFSNAGFDILDKILHSQLHQYIRSFQYTIPQLLKPEIRNYEKFKTDFLNPQIYVELCGGPDYVDGDEDWHDHEYLGCNHPSYTDVYETIRRRCAEQQSIIDTGRDAELLNLAFKQFFNLKELVLVFCEFQGESWEEEYQEVCDMMEQNAYAHHVQVVLNALVSAGSPFQEIQLTALTHRDHPSLGSPQWNSLTTLLTALVGHAPVLRLVGSSLALALLSRTNLSLRELDLCSIHTTRAFVKSFLQNNVKSLRSLKFHNIMVEDRDRLDLTPRDVHNMIKLVHEEVPRIDRFPCSRSFREGWKFYFAYVGAATASKAGKRKWNDCT